MGNMTPLTPVAGAAAPSLPYGLFSVFAPRTDSEVHWQGGGVTWQHLAGSTAAELDRIGVIQQDGTAQGLPKTLTDDPFAVSDASAFTVYAAHKVSPVAWNAEDSQAFAEERLRRYEERTVETALETTVLTTATDITPTGITTYKDARLGVAALEVEMAGTYTALGVIHMSRDLASLLLTDGCLTTKGGSLITKLGTPIVAGTGYTSLKMFWTPALMGYRSEIITSQISPTDLFDMAKNDQYSIAERTYLIGYDELALSYVDLTL